MKKQDSYTMALEEDSDEDYIDKEIKRKIALKRTESVKSVVKECINENEDILYRIKRRTKQEQDVIDKLKTEQNNLVNKTVHAFTTAGGDSNANIKHQDNGEENKAACVIQAIFKGQVVCKFLNKKLSSLCAL